MCSFSLNPPPPPIPRVNSFLALFSKTNQCLLLWEGRTTNSTTDFYISINVFILSFFFVLPPCVESCFSRLVAAGKGRLHSSYDSKKMNAFECENSCRLFSQKLWSPLPSNNFSCPLDSKDGFMAWTGLMVNSLGDPEWSVFDRRTGIPIYRSVEMVHPTANGTQCVYLKDGQFYATDCTEKVTTDCICEGECALHSAELTDVLCIVIMGQGEHLKKSAGRMHALWGKP